MFKYIKFKLLTEKDTLKNLPDASEGLDNKIYKEILCSNSPPIKTFIQICYR